MGSADRSEGERWRPLAGVLQAPAEGWTLPGVREVWQAAGDAGLQALGHARDAGGSPAPLAPLARALEALAALGADADAVFGLGAQVCACQLPIDRFGSDRARSAYLAELREGRLVGAHAMSEPSSGSDAFSLETRATPRTDGGYELTGVKSFVTNGAFADVFVVFATVDRARGFAGVTAFVVDASAPGVSVSPVRTAAGGAWLAELSLDRCPVAPDAVLGKPGGGLAIFNWTMLRERTVLVAPAVGRLRRSVERARTWLSSAAIPRPRLGPLAQDAAGSLATTAFLARCWLDGAVARLDDGTLRASDAAAAKLFVSEATLRAHRDLERLASLVGSQLAPEEGPLTPMTARVYSGTSEVLRDIVGGSLGL